MCSDVDQFDGYVECGLVLSVSDGGLAHVSGRILIVMASALDLPVGAMLFTMLYVLCPCCCLMKGCLQKIVFLCSLSILYG